MKVRIFVRESGKSFEGGHFGGKPVDFEAMPRVGDHVAHPDEKAWLRVDIVAIGCGPNPKHELYVTKVDQPHVVRCVEVEGAQRGEDDAFDSHVGR